MQKTLKTIGTIIAIAIVLVAYGYIGRLDREFEAKERQAQATLRERGL